VVKTGHIADRLDRRSWLHFYAWLSSSIVKERTHKMCKSGWTTGPGQNHCWSCIFEGENRLSLYFRFLRKTKKSTSAQVTGI
jgi:hypothetical protein